jgi:hypothetical protein
VATHVEERHWQAAAAVRRLHARLRWSECTTGREKARFLLRRAVQPLVAFKQAADGTRTYGRLVAQVARVSRARQFMHQWAIGIRFGFGWDAYYRYRLYRHADVRSTGLFMTLEANMAMREYLYAKLGIDSSRLSDKRKFYRTCLQHGLAVAPTVADFENGEVCWWPGSAAGVLPPRDVFSKEAANIKGRGAARWIWLGEDRYRDEDGQSVTGAEVIAHLRRRSHSAPYVLQERLANHPSIARFAPDTLCTVRVVTYRRPGAEPEHLASTFRMAGGSFPADNFSQGGLACRVDDATGELWPAVFKELHDTAVDHLNHPVFGTPIAGFRLPQGERVIDLALRTHRVFPDIPSVGWDVAITPEGPVLIEANYNWNVVLTQQAGARPIGETLYLVSCLEHLKIGALGSSAGGGGAEPLRSAGSRRPP